MAPNVMQPSRTTSVVAVAAVSGSLLLGLSAALSANYSILAICLGAVIAAGIERTGRALTPGNRASASFLVVLATAALAGPFGGGLAGLGAALGATLLRGKGPSRVLFNGGSLVSAGVAAGSVLSLAGNSFAALLVASLVATAVNFGLSALLVSFVIATDAGRRAGRQALAALVSLAPSHLVFGAAAIVLTVQASGEGLFAYGALAVLLIAGCGVVRAAVENVAGRLRPALETQEAPYRAAA